MLRRVAISICVLGGLACAAPKTVAPMNVSPIAPGPDQRVNVSHLYVVVDASASVVEQFGAVEAHQIHVEARPEVAAGARVHHPRRRLRPDLREPQLQGLAASAMGFHGSSEGLRRLGELVAARDTNHVTRAASIDGIGMLLGRTPALGLTELSRHANFTLFTPWTDGMLQVTL